MYILINFINFKINNYINWYLRQLKADRQSLFGEEGNIKQKERVENVVIIKGVNLCGVQEGYEFLPERCKD
jgi:hypothetical protein